MSEPPSETVPHDGEVWERREDGRAAVRIGRVWRGNLGGHQDRYVRCHPVRGGRWWFTTVTEFVKRYRPVRGGETNG